MRCDYLWRSCQHTFDNIHSLRSRAQGQRFQIKGPDQIRLANFADASINIYFKEGLTDLLIEDWVNYHMVPYIGNKIICINYLECHKYEVHQGKVQRTPKPLLTCLGHEEADTKICPCLSVDLWCSCFDTVFRNRYFNYYVRKHELHRKQFK